MEILDRYRGFCRWLLLAAATLCCGVAHAERVHRFVISINPQLTQIDVRACFDGQPPERLVAQSLDATIALVGVRNESTGKAIKPSGYIPLKSVPDGGCLSYQADVSRPINLHDRTGGKIRRVGEDLAAAVGLWLWRPERHPSHRPQVIVGSTATRIPERTFSTPEPTSTTSPAGSCPSTIGYLASDPATAPSK